MSVLAIFTGNDITRDKYESLRREIHWEKQHPPGAIFHAAALDEQGRLHVCDVWDSAESLNAFVEFRLMPAMKKLQISPPSVSVYPAFNLNAFPAVEKHILR